MYPSQDEEELKGSHILFYESLNRRRRKGLYIPDQRDEETGWGGKGEALNSYLGVIITHAILYGEPAELISYQ